MTTLLMNTEVVTQLAARLRQTARLVMESSASLQQNVTYMPWESSTRDQYVNEVREVMRRLRMEAEKLNALADLTQREVNQWIETDEHLGGTTGGLRGNTQLTGSALYGNNGVNVPPMANMHDLTRQLWDFDENGNPREGTPPIRIMKVNDNEYVVLLRGTETKFHNWSNNWGSAILSGTGIPSDYERKVRDMIQKNVPAGATIHLFGHSQGGIVANNISDNTLFSSQYNIASVTTFGSPISALENSNVGAYRRYWAGDDPVPLANMGTLINTALFGFSTAALIGVSGQTQIDSDTLVPFDAHGSYPRSQMLIHEKLPFTISTWEQTASGGSEAEYGLSKSVEQFLLPGDAGEWVAGGVNTIIGTTVSLGLGEVNLAVDGFRRVLPPSLGQQIDIIRDNLMETYAYSPQPSALISSGVASASNTVQSAAQYTSQWASDTAQQAAYSINHLVPQVF